MDFTPPPTVPEAGPLRTAPTKDELGILGEQHAETHLVARGHIVLERRWRSRHGELDLITLDDDVLVGVEVKTRRGRGYGHPFEAVTGVKLARLHRLLREYAAQHPGVRVPLRIDVVAVLFPPGRRGASTLAEAGLGVPQIEHLEDVRS
ncbi:YraN family protein [Nesterenkonia xinjiangensis]|uniref:UPF0102 protein HNR09_003117 n=1 Tax=Nesterenkonia xinjiangensis TaxID=225327 RepID=A0A7Z0GPE2_9MICC|nr:YraN family protein [Nesterenkonia xinjiangensis]NYJ79706.1 putative endonuclease [Nesterenkonia xinjiangensis]